MLRGWLLACGGCSTVLGLGDPAPAPDAPPPPSCAVGIYDLCAHQQPFGPIDFTMDSTIATDQNCDFVLFEPSSPGACVVFGTDIRVAVGTTLSASGQRPLVIAATGTVTIDGTIDVSSAGQRGAGSNDASCSVKRAITYDPSGNGGGAGGTFGGKGGDGGNGAAGGGGLASDVATPPAFPRGGCAGGNGGIQSAGSGGGGIWIAASTAIVISASARVLAGGAGAPSGSMGPFSSPSASGGGSGGMIHLGAPSVTIAGTLAANGGGGGEGGFSGTPSQSGAGGADGTASSTPAAGGAGMSANGGDGGNGAAGAILAGANGKNSSTAIDSFGGGGGGGAGIIQLVSPSLVTTGATISPPAQ